MVAAFALCTVLDSSHAAECTRTSECDSVESFDEPNADCRVNSAACDEPRTVHRAKATIILFTARQATSNENKISYAFRRTRLNWNEDNLIMIRCERGTGRR